MSSAATPPPDPAALLRSPAYAKLLALAALIGLPVAAVSYGFLELVHLLQHALFESIPEGLGFASVPVWWPLGPLLLAGLLVAAALRYLPGTGGHSPADGFVASGPGAPVELPGIFLAALASLSFGVVLGPEAPLIAIGGGLGALAVRLVARDAPATAAAVISAAGSFAAISSLLGSPLLGAFLLLEASGLGGAMLGVVLVPGLLAAGVGSLIFIGLDSLTGLGTFSLAIPHLPPVGPPTGATFAYAVAFGLAAAVVGRALRMSALLVRARVQPHNMVLMPVLGLVVGGAAIGYAEATGNDVSDVLFSGQTALGPLIDAAATYSVGALLLLCLCKGIAYAVSLSSFRGGPVFPAMFIGAAGAIAASHLPGLPLIPAVAMGMGAMCAVMLSLPLTSVLLATLLLGADGVNVMPVVIVAVVVAYVAAARLGPPATAAQKPATR